MSWKEQFLKSGINNVDGSSRILNKLADVESEQQRDFAEFDDRNLVLKTIGNISSNMLINVKLTIYTLNQYCQWCFQQGYTSSNIMEGIQPDDVDKSEKIQRSMFKNAKQCQRFLDLNRPIVSLNDFASMYIAYLWLIWMGCLPKECIEIKKQNIHLQDGFLINRQHIVHLVEESKYSLYCALNLIEGRWGGTGGMVPVVQSPYLLVNSVGRLDPKKLNDMDRKYRNRFNSYTINWQDVFLSGCFDRMQQRKNPDIEQEYIAIGYRLAEAKAAKVSDRLHHEKIGDVKWIHEQWLKTFFK